MVCHGVGREMNNASPSHEAGRRCAEKAGIAWQGIQKTLPEILSVQNGAAPRWIEVKWVMLPYTPGESSYRCRASITEQGVHRLRRAQSEETRSTSSSCPSSSPCSWAEEQNELAHDDASDQSELLNGAVMPAQPRLSCRSHTDESQCQQISSPRKFIGKLTRSLVGLMEYINSPRGRPQFDPSNPRYSCCQVIVNSNPPILAELNFFFTKIFFFTKKNFFFPKVRSIYAYYCEYEWEVT
jgi:hypothetical protein